MIRHRGRLLTGLLAAALLWAPLPFGSVTPAAETGLAACAFLAFALALAALPERSRSRSTVGLRALKPVAGPALALVLLALLGVVQSLPWPAGLAGRLSPAHARLTAEAAALTELRGDRPLPAATEAPAAAPSTVRLTLSPAATRSSALLFAALAAALLAGAAVSPGEGGRARRRVLAAALLAGAAFQTLYGLRGWLARSPTIWGEAVPGSPVRLRGTFINSNHCALYLEMAMAVAFAWGVWALRRAREESLPLTRLQLVLPPAIVWLGLAAGLVASGSRGGLLAAAGAVLVQTGLVAVSDTGAWRRRAIALGLAAALAAALAGLVTLAVFGERGGLGRLRTLSPYEVSWAGRRQAYAGALELWRRFPFSGSGLGTFHDAFPLVQPAGLRGTWWHAHNGFLELLATTGVLGAALLVCGVAALVARLLVVLVRGVRSEDRAAALAACGLLAAVVVHENVDFGLTLPANAFTLAVLVGAAATARTGPSARKPELVEPG